MKQYFPLTLMLVLVLSGCNLPAGTTPNMPDPVATGSPSEAATAPPATAPLPTPTRPPDLIVLEGERDLHNGDWDAAATAFQNVLNNPGATQAERSAAKIGLAQAALEQGDFAMTVSALDQFIAENPDDPRLAQAYFLRGDARLGTSDWAGAIADYEQYLTLRPGVIDSYVHERIGDAYIGLVNYDEALAAYGRALEAPRYLVGELILRERVATLNRSLGNPDAAIAQYNAILDVAQNDGYRASIQFYIAQTLFEAERFPQAYEQFRFVFETYPFRYEAYSSLVALLEGGFEVDPYQRGLVNYNQRNWEPALASLLDYVAVSGLDYPPDSHLFIAQAYRALGNFQAAESELNALITRFQPDDGTSWALAHLELADLQAALGNVEGAFATLDAFVEDYPELPQAADALHQAGVLARSQGDIQRAGGYFTRLANNYASDPRGAEGLFSLGIDSYVAADFPTAEGYFTRAAQASGNPEPEAGTFWLGKTLLQSGRAEDAAGVFDNLTVLNPNGYHALRAQDIQANQVPFADPVGLTVPADRDAGRAETEQWLVETFALTEQPPLALTLRSDIAADPRLARAQELWTLGMEEDAKQDFEAIRVAYRDDPLASYQLAVTFRDIGLYRSSIMSAGAVYRLAGIHPLEGPDFLARLFYPVYFDDLVVAYSQQYDLDPLFVFSLIYQESLFEGFATSSASAQGLMQIWPPTGEDIAVALNWPDYRTSELRRPVVSVAFGTWLLNEEAERFDGDRFAMLAAYNGGPGNTATWLDGTNGDPDLFVESITFSETERYIKRIYEHYHIYQTLYGEP